MTNNEFTQLVKQYERLVYTICYQFTKDHQLAEDLTQETFLSAYTHQDDCPPSAYKPWLARIATNKAKDHLKSAYYRKVKATEDDTIAQDIKGAQPASEDIVIEYDAALRIQKNITELKEPYQKVAIRFFLQQKSVEEIATELSRPPKTVHTQLYRAKQMLKKTLTEEGIA